MSTQKVINLKWYFDAGHGWLRIRRSDARLLGILDQISEYSYQSKAGNVIYCEEDSDAKIVMDALMRSNYLLQFLPDHRSSYRPSPVRSLPQYRKPILYRLGYLGQFTVEV